MPAEGAMQTRLEAPAQEPRNDQAGQREIHPAGVIVAVVGPSGCGMTTLLELVCGLQAPDAGTVRAAPAVLMPQRDLLLPWAGALDNAALAARVAGASR